jgi:pyridoxine kinase
MNLVASAKSGNLGKSDKSDNSTNTANPLGIAPPPRVAAIHDISGAGKCSLTVALPVLSAMGAEVCVMPTAYLSAHTGIPGFTYRDMTEDMPGTAEHWAALGLRFDAIYTGFASSAAQLRMISGAVDLLRNPSTLALVDPVMGDHGALYKTYTQDMVTAMRRLCAKANVITPNLTEAALLLDQEYDPSARTAEALKPTLRALADLGPGKVVITGVTFDNGTLGAAAYDAARDEDMIVGAPAVEGVWYGTGDLFASVLLGGLLAGATLNAAIVQAVGAAHEAIERTRSHGTDPRLGVHFEADLALHAQFAMQWRVNAYQKAIADRRSMFRLIRPGES